MITGQAAVAVLCGWEGNRRSGVAPVMRHRRLGISSYTLNCLRKGTCLHSCGSMAPFTFCGCPNVVMGRPLCFTRVIYLVIYHYLFFRALIFEAEKCRPAGPLP